MTASPGGFDPASPGAVASAPTRRELFTAFFKVGILGFGGVAALARHVLVTERALLSEREFAEWFGVGSALPGANTVNLATMLGDQARGFTGALAAVSGLMAAPLVLVVLIASAYERFSHSPDVRAALAGAAAAAGGLAIATGLRLARSLGPNTAALIVAAIVAIAAITRVPMWLILAVAVPTMLAIVARERRAAR